MRHRLEAAFLRQWYADKPGWSLGLAPLSGLLKCVAGWRYQRFRRQTVKPHVPLLVVGNISVGGTGKTPLVIALCEHFSQQGLKPVVISRGYGSAAPDYPFVVTADSKVGESGDEPLLIAQRSGLPVVIDADRQAAMQKALTLEPDLIISDDGLQHYRLARSAELVVLDGERGLGNGWCLPTGPLREGQQRLAEVDWVVINGGDFDYPNAYHMQLAPGDAINLLTGERRSVAQLAEQGDWVALAGIGNPERFFSTLEAAGMTLERYAFADHHQFTAADLALAAGRPLIMTEKDAVKCRHLAANNHWYLPIDAQLPATLLAAISKTLLQRHT